VGGRIFFAAQAALNQKVHRCARTLAHNTTQHSLCHCLVFCSKHFFHAGNCSPFSPSLLLSCDENWPFFSSSPLSTPRVLFFHKPPVVSHSINRRQHLCVSCQPAPHTLPDPLFFRPRARACFTQSKHARDAHTTATVGLLRSKLSSLELPLTRGRALLGLQPPFVCYAAGLPGVPLAWLSLF